jgi:assimilatory nitrate reductase catalytic subunit
MILCHCTGVTDRAVVQMIHDGATSVAEITRRSGAGQCCASCRTEIAALLSAAAPPAGQRQAVGPRDPW